MTARKDNVQSIELLGAVILAGLTTPKRTGVVTSLLWPWTWLWALKDAMPDIGVTASTTFVSAAEAFIAAEIAASVWCKLEEIVRLLDQQRCLGMSGALQLKGWSKVPLLLEHLQHMVPRVN